MRRNTTGMFIPVATMWALSTVPALAFFHEEPNVEQGGKIYAERCAACHGSKLERRPDWQTPKPDGTYPAPPHNQTGHTWHHDDAMLTDYVARGGQVVLEGMGVEFRSGMPAFGDVLSAAEIADVLAFIKSTWPEQIKAIQAERTRLMEAE